VPAIEHLGDLIDTLGPRRGVARSGPQVDVPEPRRDLMDGYAGLEQMRRPVGPEHVRMRQPPRAARQQRRTRR
jgi:hypothetical protein